MKIPTRKLLLISLIAGTSFTNTKATNNNKYSLSAEMESEKKYNEENNTPKTRNTRQRSKSADIDKLATALDQGIKRISSVPLIAKEVVKTNKDIFSLSSQQLGRIIENNNNNLSPKKKDHSLNKSSLDQAAANVNNNNNSDTERNYWKGIKRISSVPLIAKKVVKTNKDIFSLSSQQLRQTIENNNNNLSPQKKDHSLNKSSLDQATANVNNNNNLEHTNHITSTDTEKLSLLSLLKEELKHERELSEEEAVEKQRIVKEIRENEGRVIPARFLGRGNRVIRQISRRDDRLLLRDKGATTEVCNKLQQNKKKREENRKEKNLVFENAIKGKGGNSNTIPKKEKSQVPSKAKNRNRNRKMSHDPIRRL